jgi:hypothetical protein
MNIDKEIIECKISTLETPEEIKKALFSISNLLNEKMASEHDWDYTTGNLPMPDLPRPLDIYFEIWELLNDINEIFENINIVFNDLKVMRDDPKYFTKCLNGDPVTRYKLLTRTFFYEFFRIKERFNNFLARFRKKGLLKPQDAKEIKSDFYKEFETAIKVRNDMIHNRYLWPGKGHLKLHLVLSAEAVGGALADKETGNIVDKNGLLSELSGEAIQAFLLESLTIKSCFLKVIESIVKIIRKMESY